jgi:hypothetical protein
MNREKAIYQLKQRIKIHELEGTTSNENEREKTLLNYITNLEQENKEYKMIFDTFSKRLYAHRYLEEKKIPEKLDTLTYTNRNTISIWNEHRDKINEIIDYLKSKGK